MFDDATISRFSDELKTTANAALYRKAWWKFTANKCGYCTFCKPHRGMDQKWSRHARTDRYKNHRRRR